MRLTPVEVKEQASHTDTDIAVIETFHLTMTQGEKGSQGIGILLDARIRSVASVAAPLWRTS
ncbi:MAG: hypothetical protein C4326_15400 [Ignavibacteria bacterium]